MTAEQKLIPTSSQTVGPYFHIGLQHLFDQEPLAQFADSSMIVLRGKVLDRDRAPVPDAVLEFWMPEGAKAKPDADRRKSDLPSHFRRVATDLDGQFSVRISRPVAVEFDDHILQAPHALVLLFARGLLRHLISRVYFDTESGNSFDPVLLGIPPERRRTLIAQSNGEDSFRWDVILQGAGETVFFAW